MVLLLSALLLAELAGAQSKQLDPGFHNNGFVVTDFGMGPGRATSTALLPDGKFLLGGTAWNGTEDFTLVRYNADGSPDPSFGSHGRAFIDIDGADRLVFIHALPDGKILLAGSSGLSDYGPPTAAWFTLVRCLPDGRPDPTFGDNGRARTATGLSGNNYATGAAVQPDGKILITGNIADPYFNDPVDIAVLRYTPDGALDTAFGIGGIALVDAGPGKNQAGGVALQADGNIVIAGVRDTLGGDILLARLLPNGMPDTSFGIGGLVRTNLFAPNDSFPFPSYDVATAVLVQPDSMIVVVGHSYHDSNVQHLVAVRYSSEGILDRIMPAVPGGLGSSGHVDTYEEGLAVALQPDGKIVAAGNFFTRNSDMIWEPNFFLVRFNPGGDTDDSFGGHGLKIIGINDYDRAQTVSVLPGGEILAAGQTYDRYNAYDDIDLESAIAVIRLDSSGAFDTTLVHTGIAITPAGTNTDRGTDVTLQADGKILVGAVIDTVFPYTPPVKTAPKAGEAGYFTSFSPQNIPNFVVARYSDDGTLDATFGKNGRTGFTANEPGTYYTTEYSSLYPTPYAPLKTAIAQRQNGNILVAGSREFDFGIAEFYPNGTQDSLFLLSPGDTLVLPIVRKIDFSNGVDVATAIIADGDIAPNILQPGYTVAGYSDGKMAVAWCCYVPNLGNGSRRALVDINPSADDYATSVGYQADTALNQVYTVVGGYSTEGFSGLPRMFLLRLQNEDSYGYSLHPDFGDAGIVRLYAGDSTDLIHALVVEPDNSIVAAGAVDDRMAIFRFLPNGTPDPGFGTGGITTFAEGLAAHDVVVQPNGKIVVTGRSANRVITARVLPNGQPDPAFGINGVLITELRGKKDQGYAVTLQDDGKIVVAGSSDDSFAGIDIAVLRYFPNSGVPALVLSAAVQAVTCPYGDDGQVTISATGGVPPYAFLWITGDTTATLSGVEADAYSLTVTDSEGRLQVLAVVVQEPAPLDAGIAIDAAAVCDPQPGMASATPEGGTPPYVLAWSTGDSGTTATIPAGDFSCTLTDAKGCSEVFTGTMPAANDTTPPMLNCPGNIVSNACASPVIYPIPSATDNCGVASVALTTGFPPGSVFPEGTTLVAYQATDSSGNTGVCSFEVRIDNTVTLMLSVQPGCPGDSNTLSALASGGTLPYSYSWSNGAADPVLSIPAGTYTLTLTDGLGCTRLGTADIQNIPSMSVTAAVTPAWIGFPNGAISATVSGGDPPYVYAWYSNGIPVGDSTILVDIPAGDYTLIVTDAAGCTTESIWTVPEIVATVEPENVLLCQIFPNPFTETSWLQLALRHSADVRWRICDLAGRCFDESLVRHTEHFKTELNTAGLPSGMYLLQLWTGTERRQQKLVKISP